MAQAFNLTAQINLQGPSNLKKIAGEIRRELSSIKTDLNIKISPQAARGIDNITQSVQGLNAVLIEAQNNAARLGTTLSSFGGAVNNVARSTGTAASGMQQLVTSSQTAQKEVAAVSSEIVEFGKQSALAVRRFAAFSVPTAVIFGVGRAFQVALADFIAFDKGLIKLQQTTGGFSSEIEAVSAEITRLSTSLGVSSSDLLDVSVTLAQAGLSAQETQIALEALAKSALAPSFDSIQETTEGAIAAFRQFGLSASDLGDVLGSINAVAAAFAVESSDIISAIQRTGGVFASASKGISEGKEALNEFIAVFTSVRATTRESAETIATGLRTIFTRIQRGSTIGALREYGIELTDLDGKFVGAYEAVRLLSEGLNKLDPRDIRFSQIVEELGGFRQIGKVIPLIQQFQTTTAALDVAQKGQSSTTLAAIQAQQSLAVQFSKTRESFDAFVRSLGESNTFKNIISFGLTLTNTLISVASAFKPILPYLAIMGAIKGGAAVAKFTGGFLSGLKKNKDDAPSGQADLLSSIFGASTQQKERTGNDISDRLESILSDNTNALTAMTNALSALETAVNNNTRSGGGASTLSNGGRVMAFATGGVVPGNGKGDKVPALLEPGEVVINNRAANKYGRGNLVRMNKYATGGAISLKELESRSGGESIKEAYSDTVQPQDKIRGNLNRKPLTVQPNDPQWNNVKKTAIDYYQKYKQQNPDASDKKLKTIASADAFEDFVATLTRGERTSQSYPVDVIGKRNPIEAKFTIKRTPYADLLSKLFRYRYEQNSLKTYDFTKNTDPDVFLGQLDVFEMGSGEKKQFEKLYSFSEGSPGGIRLSSGKGRGVRGARGARSRIEPVSTETYLSWAKGIYDEYDADPSLVMSIGIGGERSPPEIALANKLLTEYAFETGGAGLAVGRKFVRTPKDKITDELKPYLVTDPSDPNEMGFYEDIIAKFGRSKKLSIAATSKLGKQSALKAAEARMDSYTSAENAIAEFKKTGTLNVDPPILNYLKQSIDNPNSLPLDSDEIESLKKKLTKPNLDAFNALVGSDSVPVGVQGQRTKLSEVFNTILETYGSDVSNLEIDNIIKGVGSKIQEKYLGGQIQNFVNGGFIQKFMAGGKVDDLTGLTDIESRLLSQFNMQEVKKPQNDDVEGLISVISAMGNNESVRNLSGIQSMVIDGVSVRSGDILSANKLRSARYAKYAPYARQIIEAAVPKYNKRLVQEANMRTAMTNATRFQLATLFPFDADRTIKDMINGQPTIIHAKGVPSSYLDIIERLQRDLSDPIDKAAEEFQMRKIFGSQASPVKPLVFDFDETLIENLSDVMKAPDGSIDIAGFSDLPRVEKGLKDIRLTRLGEVLKAKLSNQEISLNDLRVVTARPQSNAPYIAQALSNLGLNIPENKITGVSGAENKINNVSELETLIDDRVATVEQFRAAGRKAVAYSPVVSELKATKAVYAGQTAMEGAAAEKLLAKLGAPLRPDAEPGRPIDYPDGLGISSQYWDFDPTTPTEVKRELNSSAIQRTKEEIGRYYKLASGGMLTRAMAVTKRGEGKEIQRYKQILASILPSEFLTDTGFLKTPSGEAEPISIIPDQSPVRSVIGSLLSTFGKKTEELPDRAYYSGGLPYKALRSRLEKNKASLAPEEYKALKSFVDQNLAFEGNDDTISLMNARHSGVLAHETFHDIQGYLYDNYPEIIDKIFSAVEMSYPDIEAWYANPASQKWSGPPNYQLDHLFPTLTSKSPYPTTVASNARKSVEKRTKQKSSSSVLKTLSDAQLDLGRLEAVPVLMSAAAEGNAEAASILSNIFSQAGLNSDFYKTLPKFSDGGIADSPKKSKQYGKIGLRNSGSEITATYFKNADRSGMVTAKKFADNLYTVGLSQATGGYGPRLYDAVMESATSSGAMLTSDRQLVSGAAKAVWDYYFSNRSDVQKTPLDSKYWTQNQSLIDPKLYGPKDTWPPFDDPAWVLQTGYSKSPDLINSPDIINMNDPKYAEYLKQQQLGFLSRQQGGITKLAGGGTVPAMVSNGEAYVSPQAAKKIGYSRLNKMNQADRNGMKNFASGGGVSIFRGAGSGTSDSIGPVSLPTGSFVIRAKATKALGLNSKKYNKGGSVGVQRFSSGGKTYKADDFISMIDYSDVTGVSASISNNGQKYAQALADAANAIGDIKPIQELVQKLQDALNKQLADIGMQPSQFGLSQSWAMWDIGKQLHLQKNPNESSNKYRLGDPLNDSQLQQEMVDRMAGWEIGKAKGNLASSSWRLTEIGREARTGSSAPPDNADLTQTQQKFSLITEAAGKSLDQLSRSIKEFTTNTALSYQQSVSSRQRGVNTSLAIARETKSEESYRLVADQIKNLYKELDIQVDSNQLNDILDKLFKELDLGTSVQQIKQNIPELGNIVDTTINDLMALNYGLRKATDKFGTLLPEMSADDLDLRATRSVREGRFSKGDARSLQAASETATGRFAEYFGGNKIPGLSLLMDPSSQLAKRLGELTEKFGGFIGVVGSGTAILSSSLPGLYNSIDRFTGSTNFANSPRAAGIQGAMSSGGTNALGAAKLAQDAGFGARGTAVAGLTGAVLGGLEGYFKSYGEQAAKNSYKAIAQREDSLNVLFKSLASENLDPARYRELQTQTMSELVAISKEVGTVLENTEHHWSTTVYNSAEALMQGVQSMLAALALIGVAKMAIGKSKGGPVGYYSRGSSVFKPRGTDTVPAMLTPGEFVVNAKSAKQNRGLLEDINSNNYMSRGGVVYASGGKWIKSDKEAGRYRGNTYAGTLSDFYNPFDEDFYKSSNDATEAVLKFGGRLAGVTAVIAGAAASVISLGPVVGTFFQTTLPGLFSTGFAKITTLTGGAWSKITGFFGGAKAAATTWPAGTLATQAAKTTATVGGAAVGGAGIGAVLSKLSTSLSLIAGGTFLYNAVSSFFGSSTVNKEQQQNLAKIPMVFDQLIKYAGTQEILNYSLEDLIKTMDGARNLKGEDRTDYFTRGGESILQTALKLKLETAGVVKPGDIKPEETVQQFMDRLKSNNQELPEGLNQETILKSKIDTFLSAYVSRQTRIAKSTPGVDEKKFTEDLALKADSIRKVLNSKPTIETLEELLLNNPLLKEGRGEVGRLQEEQNQARLNQQLFVEIKNQADLFNVALNKFTSSIKKASAEFDQSFRQLNLSIGTKFGDKPQIQKTDRKALIPLENILSASSDEIKASIAEGSKQLGLSPQATKTFEQKALAEQVIRQNLPEILTNLQSDSRTGDLNEDSQAKQIEDQLTTLFEKALAGTGLESRAGSLARNVSQKALASKRQGSPVNDILTKDGALNTIIKDVLGTSLESFKQSLNDVYEVNDKLIAAYQKQADMLTQVTEAEISAQKTRTEGALALKKAMGESTSLDELNQSFNDQIRSLTKTEVVGGGRAGTTDAGEIGRRLDEADKLAQDLQEKIRLPVDKDPQKEAQNEKDRQKNASQLAKVTSESAKLQKALNDLANNTSSASNALSKIQDLRQVNQGRQNVFFDLIRNISNPDFVLEKMQDISSYQRVTSGNGNLLDLEGAVRAFELRASTLPQAQAQQERAAFADKAIEMLSRGNQNDPLIMSLMDYFKKAFNENQSPEMQNLQDQYRASVEAVGKAGDELVRRMQTGIVTWETQINNSGLTFYNKVTEAANILEKAVKPEAAPPEAKEPPPKEEKEDKPSPEAAPAAAASPPDRASLETAFSNALADNTNSRLDTIAFILRQIQKTPNNPVSGAGFEEVSPQTASKGKLITYASQGQYINFKPKGTDTVPAMLTPGEFVVNKKATQKNLGLLQAINNNKTLYAADGALVPGSTPVLSLSNRKRIPTLEEWLQLTSSEQQVIINQLGRNPYPNYNSTGLFTTVSGAGSATVVARQDIPQQQTTPSNKPMAELSPQQARMKRNEKRFNEFFNAKLWGEYLEEQFDGTFTAPKPEIQKRRDKRLQRASKGINWEKGKFVSQIGKEVGQLVGDITGSDIPGLAAETVVNLSDPVMMASIVATGGLGTMAGTAVEIGAFGSASGIAYSQGDYAGATEAGVTAAFVMGAHLGMKGAEKVMSSVATSKAITDQALRREAATAKLSSVIEEMSRLESVGVAVTDGTSKGMRLASLRTIAADLKSIQFNESDIEIAAINFAKQIRGSSKEGQAVMAQGTPQGGWVQPGVRFRPTPHQGWTTKGEMNASTLLGDLNRVASDGTTAGNMGPGPYGMPLINNKAEEAAKAGMRYAMAGTKSVEDAKLVVGYSLEKIKPEQIVDIFDDHGMKLQSFASDFASRAGYKPTSGEKIRSALNNSILEFRKQGIGDDVITDITNELYSTHNIKLITGANELLEGAGGKGKGSVYTGETPLTLKGFDLYRLSTPSITKSIDHHQKEAASRIASYVGEKTGGVLAHDAEHHSLGGIIYASKGKYINFQPKGTDTVPAMLTPGEFVVNKKATQNNLGLLKQINSGSKAYSSGGVVYARTGGEILDDLDRVKNNIGDSGVIDFRTLVKELLDLANLTNSTEDNDILKDIFNNGDITNILNDIAEGKSNISDRITKRNKYLDKIINRRGDLSKILDNQNITQANTPNNDPQPQIPDAPDAGGAGPVDYATSIPEAGYYDELTYKEYLAKVKDFYLARLYENQNISALPFPNKDQFTTDAVYTAGSTIRMKPNGERDVVRGGQRRVTKFDTRDTSGVLGDKKGSRGENYDNSVDALEEINGVPQLTPEEMANASQLVQEYSDKLYSHTIGAYTAHKELQKQIKNQILDPNTVQWLYDDLKFALLDLKDLSDVTRLSKYGEQLFVSDLDKKIDLSDILLKLNEAKTTFVDELLLKNKIDEDKDIDFSSLEFFSKKYAPIIHKRPVNFVERRDNITRGNDVFDRNQAGLSPAGPPTSTMRDMLSSVPTNEKVVGRKSAESQYKSSLLHYRKQAGEFNDKVNKYKKQQAYKNSQQNKREAYNAMMERRRQAVASRTLAGGGVVYASNGQLIPFSPKGTDTVPAMLTPGEFVVNKKATKANLAVLKHINSSKKSYLAKGGQVQGFQGGGQVSGGGVSNSEVSIDTGPLNSAFDKFSQHVQTLQSVVDNFAKNISQLNAGFSALSNIDSGASKIAAASTSVNNAADRFGNTIASFNNSVTSLENAINKIPKSIDIKVNGSIPINISVDVNGGEGLQNELTAFKGQIFDKIKSGLKNAMPNLNINFDSTGE